VIKMAFADYFSSLQRNNCSKNETGIRITSKEVTETPVQIEEH
jgi:hypothetical protein